MEDNTVKRQCAHQDGSDESKYHEAEVDDIFWSVIYAPATGGSLVHSAKFSQFEPPRVGANQCVNVFGNALLRLPAYVGRCPGLGPAVRRIPTEPPAATNHGADADRRKRQHSLDYR